MQHYTLQQWRRTYNSLSLREREREGGDERERSFFFFLLFFGEATVKTNKVLFSELLALLFMTVTLSNTRRCCRLPYHSLQSQPSLPSASQSYTSKVFNSPHISSTKAIRKLIFNFSGLMQDKRHNFHKLLTAHD